MQTHSRDAVAQSWTPTITSIRKFHTKSKKFSKFVCREDRGKNLEAHDSVPDSNYNNV